MEYWIYGFLIGSCLGLSFHSFWIKLIPFILLCSTLKKRHASSLFFLVGLQWALLFNHPPPLFIDPPYQKDSCHFILSDWAIFWIQGYPYAVHDKKNTNHLTYDQMPYLDLLRSNIHITYDICKKGTAKKILENLSHEHYQKIMEKIKNLPKQTQIWFQAIFLGITEDIDVQIKMAFKKTGTYHLLIVSGQQFSILAKLLLYFIKLPVAFLYTFCVINPRWFLFLKKIFCLLSIFIMFCYANLLNFPQSVQRAFLLASLSIFIQTYLSKQKMSDIIKKTLFFQTIFFPIEFFHTSNLLSWLAYIIVLKNSARLKRTCFSKKIKNLLLSQIVLTLIAASFFGSLSIIGIFFNFLAIPLFSLVIYSLIFLLICHNEKIFLTQFILTFQEKFFNFIAYYGKLCDKNPYLFIDISQHPIGRSLCLIFSCFLLLKFFLGMPIGRTDQT